MITYLDACQSCPPGLPDASPSLGAPEQVPGGVVTAHQCGTCGGAWNTLWQGGWPVERLLAPVSPDQAGRDRDVPGTGTGMKEAARAA
jgi:hypothetical protein